MSETQKIRHSRLGIIAFILSFIPILHWVIYPEIYNSFYEYNNDGAAQLRALIFAGMGLAIFGLFAKNKNKFFPILALIVYLACLLTPIINSNLLSAQKTPAPPTYILPSISTFFAGSYQNIEDCLAPGKKALLQEGLTDFIESDVNKGGKLEFIGGQHEGKTRAVIYCVNRNEKDNNVEQTIVCADINLDRAGRICRNLNEGRGKREEGRSPF